MDRRYNPDTICVQGGWKPKNGEPRVLPIYQSTTYKYESSNFMGRLFDLEEEGYYYSRIQNPTNDLVAQKICDLEGGAGATLTSSGMSAIFYAVFNVCECGDHILSSANIYGGSSNLFTVTMKKMGVEAELFDTDASYEEIAAKFRPNTKALYVETVSNPALVVADLDKFSRLAKEFGVPLIVDNTFATPINCRPIEYGADIIVHSTTKYMDGHAVALGGCIVDCGTFDWMAHKEKFPGLTTPDDSYHGLIYAEKFGKTAFINKVIAQIMRDTGACQSPMNAFLLNLGLESMHLRVRRHCENAQKIAEFLEANDQVTWVNYPGLPGNKYHELAQKYMPRGTAGVISFGLKGGKAAAQKFMDSLKLIAIVTHVADARTCILHPASTTHRQLSDEQLVEAGVSPDLLRLSVGIEDADDLLDDIKQALALL